MCACITLIVLPRGAQPEQHACLAAWRITCQAAGVKHSRRTCCGSLCSDKGGKDSFIDFIGDLFNKIAVVKKIQQQLAVIFPQQFTEKKVAVGKGENFYFLIFKTKALRKGLVMIEQISLCLDSFNLKAGVAQKVLVQ